MNENNDAIKKWKTGQNPDATVAEIAGILNKWARRALLLEILLIFLGIVAIASSLFISGFADFDFMHNNKFLVTKLLGFTSTLSLTLISAFNLSSKANSVRKGWRHLNKAFCRYNSDIVDIKELVVAYDEGEEMIRSNADFSYSRK